MNWIPVYRFSLSLALAIVLANSTVGAQETEDYSLDNYEMTVESTEGSSSVRVTLDITYAIRSGKKSTGFKYIGKADVTQLAGRDGEGKAIRTSVEYQRETRLNWSFPAAGPGKKRVIISFNLADAITNAADSNEFKAEWAGFFKVPVKRAVYRFVFPDSSERSLVVSPSDYSAFERTGHRSIEVLQVPLKQATFEMTFRPRIVNSTASTRSTSWIRSITSGFPLNLMVAVVIGGIVAAIAFIARKAKRAGTSANGSWWSSVSSCAGGSSCSSSSCGSSCGGGCGGGCGG